MKSLVELKANFLDTVKYHAYLRKMTRYNPTRGGESIPHADAQYPSAREYV